ncbi:MAG: ribosomal protein [Candidatus Aminicenantes bacterium]|nr:ribosomal protein [Candidatus Aminicenantes bacterium]
MSRYGDPVCRQCRVEKTKLFLKGDKCESEKCPVERRGYAPGQHGRARKRILGYGLQLREKQKLKRYYGMTERQFRLFFRRAERQKGITGENLLAMLERRLDNVVYVTGFARSRTHGRQLISHGHFSVNQRKVTVPSFIVDAGDEVKIRPRSAQVEDIKQVVDQNKKKTVPSWIAVDWENMTVKIAALPTRQDITLPVEEHYIVELYSK